MPIIVKDSGRDYPPAPEGVAQGVCVDVIDLGLQETQWGPKEKVEIRWQLDTVDPEGRKFIVIQRYTLSLNQKAKLRAHLEAWRGKKFTPEELKGFDLEKLLGANCQIQIIHNITDDGRVYGNVAALMPLGRGMTKIEAEEYTRVKDRPTQRGTGNGDVHGHPAEEEEEIAF